MGFAVPPPVPCRVRGHFRTVALREGSRQLMVEQSLACPDWKRGRRMAAKVRGVACWCTQRPENVEWRHVMQEACAATALTHPRHMRKTCKLVRKFWTGITGNLDPR